MVRRRVFFSFHYEADALRASQVRQSQQFLRDADEFVGYADAAEWEKIERQGEAAVKKWINDNLERTTVTAVLYGAQTATRRWVRYEILQSVLRGNGLLGVDIHALRDPRVGVSQAGINPFSRIGYTIDRTRSRVSLWEVNASTNTWIPAVDTKREMSLADFPYATSKDSGNFAELSINCDFDQPQAGQKLPGWIQAAAASAGR